MTLHALSLWFTSCCVKGVVLIGGVYCFIGGNLGSLFRSSSSSSGLESVIKRDFFKQEHCLPLLSNARHNISEVTPHFLDQWILGSMSKNL